MKTSMFDIELQAKSSAPEDGRYTSMRRNSGARTGVTASLLLLLLALLLLPSLVSAAEQPKVVFRLVKMLIWETAQEANDSCIRDLGFPPEEIDDDAILTGCAVTDRGVTRMAVVEPKSFCDWEAVDTWGHELMHSAGYHHDERHMFLGGENNWEARHCEIIDE